jgi:hypothetical protein
VTGCASTGAGFDRLPASEQALFRRCSEPVSAQICSGSGQDRADCLAAKAEAFAGRQSDRMRRLWLASNGCPASVIEAPQSEPAVASEGAAGVEEVAGAVPAAQEAVAVPAAQDLAVAPPAAQDLAVAPPAAQDLAVASPALTSTAPPPAPVQAAVAPEPLPAAVVETSRAVVTEPATPSPTASPASGPAPAERPAAAPSRLSARTADRQLREAIVAHQPQMKKCVDRQLKLVPTLRAEGTLVLDVGDDGRVTNAGLKGSALQGTTLEVCLRTVALGWRFPRTSRAYAVEAPLKVWGAQGAP